QLGRYAASAQGGGQLTHTNHALRHDWNERFVELAGERGWDPAEADKDQKYAMGWSSGPKMPERYAKRAIRKRANGRISAMQRKALGDA
ncbi:hypothetical protein, partial [Craurococcus roseus]|uniref:hypothetical protein n=1 Tax=Craurococcus roseus TaxID=77585 RepID=UPI0031CDEF68